MGETRFLTNREIYEQAVLKLVPSARSRLWIATADIKDMYVEKPSLTRQMVPFLQHRHSKTIETAYNGKNGCNMIHSCLLYCVGV